MGAKTVNKNSVVKPKVKYKPLTRTMKLQTKTERDEKKKPRKPVRMDLRFGISNLKVKDEDV